MSVKVDFKLTLDETNEVRALLEGRKVQLEQWILALHTSVEEREDFEKELDIVQALRRLFA